MIILYTDGECDDVWVNAVNVPDGLVDEFVKLTKIEVEAKGNKIEVSCQLIDPIEILKGCLKPAKTKKQAEAEWEESSKTKGYFNKIAVSWSGTVRPIDAMTKNEYLRFCFNETRKNYKYNKPILDLIQKLESA
jgi:hypothetical protein